MSSKWPDKFIIGLTGNIATGKSVVRRMLEHLGAYGIDADRLAHRAIAKGAPGYTPVVRTFGTWILRSDGEIDRGKLAALVFSNPDAMRRLEAIVHPLVLQAVEYLVNRSRRPVVVIEAIKLLETDLHAWCDSIWVVDAPAELQLQRLVHKRGMNESEAYQRILAQPPQAEKVARAHVVIHNDKDFEHTWKQVVTYWERVVPERFRRPRMPKPEPAPTRPPVRPAHEEAKPAPARPKFTVRRATPKDAAAIAQFLAEVTDGRERLSRGDVLARFGDRAYVLVLDGARMVGLFGWQVENLVTRVFEMYLAADAPAEAVLEQVLEHIAQARGSCRVRPCWSSPRKTCTAVPARCGNAWGTKYAAKKTWPSRPGGRPRRLRNHRARCFSSANCVRNRCYTPCETRGLAPNAFSRRPPTCSFNNGGTNCSSSSSG